MKLHARDGIRGDWLDLKTNQRLRFVRWADEDSGEYEALKVSREGKPLYTGDGKPVLCKGKTLLRFVPKTLTDSLKLNKLKEEVERPRSAADAVPERGVRLSLFSLEECEAAHCHKRAEWRTADERETPSLVLPSGRTYERAQAKLFHFFCNRHYRNPVFTSLRGVESEVKLEAGRPQW